MVGVLSMSESGGVRVGAYPSKKGTCCGGERAISRRWATPGEFFEPFKTAKWWVCESSLLSGVDVVVVVKWRAVSGGCPGS